MSKKLYIGIAGYMGSGKSMCSKIFSDKYGFKVIDADSEAKNFIIQNESIKGKLIESFGNYILENNTISFSKLGEIVFSDIGKLRLLNSIVHPPLIVYLKNKFFSEDLSRAVVLDASLIPLWKIEEWFNLRIWICADMKIRIKRLMAKVIGITEDEIRKRVIMQMQLFDEPAEENWFYLYNESTVDELRENIENYIKRFIFF